MAYDAKAVANYFLDIAIRNKTSITPMKLQKLIFFAHGWNLALFDEPLISDPIQAWPFGPVIPSIYHEFKHERSGAISCKATELDLEKFDFVELSVPAEDTNSRKLMDRIWDVYGKLDGPQLSDITHQPGTPWAEARRLFGDDEKNIPIGNAEIATFFKEQLNSNRQARQ